MTAARRPGNNGRRYSEGKRLTRKKLEGGIWKSWDKTGNGNRDEL